MKNKLEIKKEKQDIYNKYLRKIKRDYIFKRLLKYIIGLIFIIIACIVYNEYQNIFIVLLGVGLLLLLIALFDPGDHQYNQRNKDIQLLEFEYEQYLERVKMVKNHQGGELIMEWISNPKFQFD